MTTFMKEFLGFSIYSKNLKVEERLSEVSNYFRDDDNWADVVSTAIAAISYYRPKDKKQSGSILAVRFINGRTYWYSGVYVNIFSQFMSTDSKGRFVNSRIKNRYPFVEM